MSSLPATLFTSSTVPNMRRQLFNSCLPIIGCGLLIVWLSGGLAPTTWRVLVQTLLQFSVLWTAQGSALLIPLSILLIQSLLLAIAWIWFIWIAIREFGILLTMALQVEQIRSLKIFSSPAQMVTSLRSTRPLATEDKQRGHLLSSLQFVFAQRVTLPKARPKQAPQPSPTSSTSIQPPLTTDTQLQEKEDIYTVILENPFEQDEQEISPEPPFSRSVPISSSSNAPAQKSLQEEEPLATDQAATTILRRDSRTRPLSLLAPASPPLDIPVQKRELPQAEAQATTVAPQRDARTKPLSRLASASSTSDPQSEKREQVSVNVLESILQQEDKARPISQLTAVPSTQSVQSSPAPAIPSEEKEHPRETAMETSPLQEVLIHSLAEPVAEEVEQPKGEMETPSLQEVPVRSLAELVAEDVKQSQSDSEEKELPLVADEFQALWEEDQEEEQDILPFTIYTNPASPLNEEFERFFDEVHGHEQLLQHDPSKEPALTSQGDWETEKEQESALLEEEEVRPLCEAQESHFSALLNEISFVPYKQSRTQKRVIETQEQSRDQFQVNGAVGNTAQEQSNKQGVLRREPLRAPQPQSIYDQDDPFEVKREILELFATSDFLADPFEKLAGTSSKQNISNGLAGKEQVFSTPSPTEQIDQTSISSDPLDESPQTSDEDDEEFVFGNPFDGPLPEVFDHDEDLRRSILEQLPGKQRQAFEAVVHRNKKVNKRKNSTRNSQ